MIDFNATIIVQVAHFFIGWCLLDKFLFKPVVAIIQEEAATENKIKNAIEDNKKHLESEQRKQDLIWIQYRKQFEMFTPVVEMSPLLSFSALLCPVSLQMNKDEKEKLLHETKSFLREKVTHV